MVVSEECRHNPSGRSSASENCHVLLHRWVCVTRFLLSSCYPIQGRRPVPVPPAAGCRDKRRRQSSCKLPNSHALVAVDGTSLGRRMLGCRQNTRDIQWLRIPQRRMQGPGLSASRTLEGSKSIWGSSPIRVGDEINSLVDKL